jgi:putative endonuclease
MQTEPHYYVYILASRSRSLYIGVTNDLLNRVTQHCQANADSFTRQNNIHRLVHYEHFRYINNAIIREKQLKGWLRARKIALIEENNPTWEDFFLELTRSQQRHPWLSS